MDLDVSSWMAASPLPASSSSSAAAAAVARDHGWEDSVLQQSMATDANPNNFSAVNQSSSGAAAIDASGWEDTSAVGSLARRSHEADALAIAKEQLLKINTVIQEHEATAAALVNTPPQQQNSSPLLNVLSQSQSNVARFHPGGSGGKKSSASGSGGSGGSGSARRGASGEKKQPRSRIPKKASATARARAIGSGANSSFTVPH
jgi:hypothetical protein